MLNNFILKFKGIDFSAIKDGFADAPKHPTAIFAVIGIVLLAFLVIRMRKVKLTTHIMTNVGIALALSTVLKMIKFYQMPNGGSATLGSMVPILLIGLLYGSEIGFLTGLLFGVIDFILGPFIMHPVQVIFDYPLAFTALGIVGYFRDKGKLMTLAGVVFAIFARFLSHFISGIIFYGSFAPENTTPAAYAFTYNMSYILPEAILCIIVLALLPIKQIHSIMGRSKVNA
jgi:thiamine transporter